MESEGHSTGPGFRLRVPVLALGDCAKAPDFIVATQISHAPEPSQDPRRLASINEAPVTMMIDTGATTIALSFEDADRLGLNPGGYEVMRRVLGHKSMDTTSRFYAGLESINAARHFERASSSAR